MWRLLLAAALLCAPSASAGATVPVQGRLTLDAALAVEGLLRAEDDDAVVDVTEAARHGEALRLTWSHARGERVRAQWQASDLGSVKFKEASEESPVHLGAGSLSSARCGPKCHVLLLTQDARVEVDALASGDLARLDAPRPYCPMFCEGTREWRSFSVVVPAGAMSLGAPALSSTRVVARGTLLLFASDAILDVVEEGRPATLDALHRDGQSVGAGGTRLAHAFENGYVRLVLEDAELTTGEGTAAEILAFGPRLSVEGAVSSARATGALAFGEERRALHHEAFLLDGLLDVALDARGGPLDARVQGDAATLVTASFVAEAPRDAARAAEATVAVALLLVLLRLALPLYTRITRSRVLGNANRARIYARIRERRPATVAELRADTGLARVVVQHHLRMLESHGLVVKLRRGAAHAYFAVEHAPGPSYAWALLEDGTRRGLARVIASSPAPLSPMEIAAASGVSRRLAAYHLGLFRDAGLVDVRPGVPRRYAPTPTLRALLADGNGLT